MKNPTLAVAGALAIATSLLISGCGNSATSSGSSNSAGGGGEKPVIGVSFEQTNEFRVAQQKYLEDAASELGADLKFQVANNSSELQASQMKTMVAQGAKGLIVLAFDPVSIEVPIKSLSQAGVTIVGIDNAPQDVNSVKYFVGADAYYDGAGAAKKFIELAAGKPYKLLELQGGLGTPVGQMRSQGLEEGLKDAPNIQIVSKVPTDWNAAPALSGTQNALEQYPDLDGIYIPTDGQIGSVFSALKSANKLLPVGDAGHVDIISVDGDSNGCAGVKDKFIDLVLATDLPTMARDAVQQTLNGINGQPIEKSPNLLKAIELTPDNFDTVSKTVWGCLP